MPNPVLTMRPTSADAGQTIQGTANSYSPAADGTYSVSDVNDIQALLFRGWSIAITASGGDCYVADITSITPSATLNTLGAAKTLSPDTGSTSLIPLSMDLIFGGTFGSETLTVNIVVAYSDGSTPTTITSFTATGTGTTSLTLAQLRGLFVDGKSIASIAFSCKSSLSAGSSAATLEVKSHGENRAA